MVKTSRRKASVVKVERILRGFLNVDKAVVRHSLFGGGEQTVERLSVDHGDSVAILVFDKSRGTVWLTEQFRYPTHAKGPGWLREIPAGLCDHGETPRRAARREAEEEIGIRPKKLEHIATFYLSPGVSTERVTLFFAAIDGRDTASATRAQDAGEDVRPLEVSAEALMAKARDGKVEDAKTLVAGLWLLAHRDRIGL